MSTEPTHSSPIPLTDAQLDKIAEKAAVKAVEKVTGRMYEEVGRSVVSKGLTVIGVAAVALLTYLYGKGIIKL